MWSVIESAHIKGAKFFRSWLQFLWPVTWLSAVSRVPSPRQSSLPFSHWSQNSFFFSKMSLGEEYTKPPNYTECTWMRSMHEKNASCLCSEICQHAINNSAYVFGSLVLLSSIKASYLVFSKHFLVLLFLVILLNNVVMISVRPCWCPNALLFCVMVFYKTFFCFVFCFVLASWLTKHCFCFFLFWLSVIV